MSGGARQETVGRYGRWAVVAGASEGLGAAWSRALAAQGHDVVLVARRAGPLEALADAIRADHGVETRVITADLGDPSCLDALRPVAEGLDVGVLVYNACFSRVAPFRDLDEAARMATLDVNCRGPVWLASLFGEPMIARGRGAIVLMSSMSGWQGSAMVGLYAATKAFDTVFGEMLWEEWGPLGVDVLVCVAGATRTPNFDAVTPADKRSTAMPMTPEQVVAEALPRLAHGPTFVTGRINRLVHWVTTRLLSRRAAVRFISRNTRAMYQERS